MSSNTALGGAGGRWNQMVTLDIPIPLPTNRLPGDQFPSLVVQVRNSQSIKE